MVATIADIVLIFAIDVAVMWCLMFTPGLNRGLPVLGGYLLLLLLSFAQYFVLPSLIGASLGQLVCGLTLIRCADGSRPNIRDIARAVLRQRGVRFRGIHTLAPHLVVVRRRDLIAFRAAGASHPAVALRPEPPEYHGAEGDPRYPSPRDLRKATSTVIDILLIVVVSPALGAAVALLTHTSLELAMTVCFWALAPLQLVALPAWTGATLGQSLCGLTQIRGSDGRPPAFRDALGIGKTLPADIRARRDLYVTFAGLVVVRRRDVPDPGPGGHPLSERDDRLGPVHGLSSGKRL
ncbi:RDD family protein [Nocardia yamanashiensis]|uniref:RDD family protein n=1 Tax=Nocardia yamanashiensis TaxID=209247 RepID=UPI000AD3B9E9|nr:RDD family protein [Nocardia yamanashiensis]